jgi:hypothetical protein
MPPTEIEVEGSTDDLLNESTDGDDGDNDDDLQNLDAAKLQEQLRAARRSERTIKKQYGAASKELETLKQSQMTEAERIKAERDVAVAERDALNARIRERDARDVFAEEARKSGAIRPDVLFRLADGLQYDDAGNLKNVKSLVAGLRTEYPELFGAAGSSDGGNGRGAGPTTSSVSDQMRAQLGRGR